MECGSVTTAKDLQAIAGGLGAMFEGRRRRIDDPGGFGFGHTPWIEEHGLFFRRLDRRRELLFIYTSHDRLLLS